ncbi:hypothetical protein PRIPAC_89489 [Pristionchus pacificus]|uniref:Uncharacterized protein n=1 Tax=Pristionchus pacificus TaxID=54126 RepID=A0A2A6CWL1_PRIPA|nr:hypothetical protein PRIPAC_89489 [Pristionchus pacificus]|eukprot:PDM82437.1 hypothetical protein PRIPAC_36830 [Pristionchus pacificus]
MVETETEGDISTARSTSEADDDYTILPNGLIVTRIVQIWPTRTREAPSSANSATPRANSAPDVRMWMGEVRVDGARIEEACFVKLRVACKARWRSFWTCRNSHSTIEPRGVRYIQFEFPEPALDHLQLNLVAGEHEVKILLERMPGTETFLWRDTTDLRRILLARAAAIREERKTESSSDVSSTSTGIETDMETAYSPTELSEDEERDSRPVNSNEGSPFSNASKHSRRSGWTAARRQWSDGTRSLRIPEKMPSVILDREPEALAAALSPALEASLRAALATGRGSQRGALFAMVHSVVVECLQQEGVERAGEVWREIQRSYVAADDSDDGALCSRDRI